MTEQTYPYEALLAFCVSKGPAFDSFMRDWNQTKQSTPTPTIIPKEAPKVEAAVASIKKVVKEPEPEVATVAAPNWGPSKTKTKVVATDASPTSNTTDPNSTNP